MEEQQTVPGLMGHWKTWELKKKKKPDICFLLHFKFLFPFNRTQILLGTDKSNCWHEIFSYCELLSAQMNSTKWSNPSLNLIKRSTTFLFFNHPSMLSHVNLTLHLSLSSTFTGDRLCCNTFGLSGQLFCLSQVMFVHEAMHVRSTRGQIFQTSHNVVGLKLRTSTPPTQRCNYHVQTRTNVHIRISHTGCSFHNYASLCSIQLWNHSCLLLWPSIIQTKHTDKTKGLPETY